MMHDWELMISELFPDCDDLWHCCNCKKMVYHPVRPDPSHVLADFFIVDRYLTCEEIQIKYMMET